MKISLLHPTARVAPIGDFPLGWFTACRQWFAAANAPENVQYVLVVHHSRIAEFWAEFPKLSNDGCDMPAWGSFEVVVNYERDCVVDQCNVGAPRCMGEIVVSLMDDLEAPGGWDFSICEALPDTTQKMALSCLPRQRLDLLSLPSILTRELLIEVGPICPDYTSMFSDNDFAERVRRCGTVRTMILNFIHRHPIAPSGDEAAAVLAKAGDGQPHVGMDAVYLQQNDADAYEVGLAVFERRKLAGFPYVDRPDWSKPVSVLLASVTGRKTPLVAVLAPGASFGNTWLQGFLECGLRLGQEGYATVRHFGYWSNVYNTRMELTRRCLSSAAATGERPDLVWWLDHDNVISPDHLMGMIRFLDHYPDVDVLVGWCWIQKGDYWLTSVGDFAPDGVHFQAWTYDQILAGDTPQEKIGPKVITHSGFPCVLMRFDALERLGAMAFRPMTKADLPAFFGDDQPAEVGQVSDEWYSGEDTSWCLWARKAGLRMVVDPLCKVGHIKPQLQEPILQRTDGVQSVELDTLNRQIKGRPVPVSAENLV